MSALQESLGVQFDDLSLLEQALIHSSYLNENPEFNLPSNERLEFLGDAVLGLAVAEKLHCNYPDLDEGEMTRLRSALVRRETLTRMATAINLGSHLYLGKGEEATGGRERAANLAAALEAVIAAVYLDKGMSTAGELILRLINAELEKTVTQNGAADYKSELQELTQAREQTAPTYDVVVESGPDHNKVFTVEVRVGEMVLGRGSGKNKKAAESQAARSALEHLKSTFTQ
jgi:ribonuclease-3